MVNVIKRSRLAAAGGRPYGDMEAGADIDSAGPVPARKRFRTEVDAKTIRKHGGDLRHLIRGVAGFRSELHCARARIPNPWVLAAFLGYFLPLVAVSTTQSAQNKEYGARSGSVRRKRRPIQMCFFQNFLAVRSQSRTRIPFSPAALVPFSSSLSRFLLISCTSSSSRFS